MLTDLVSEFFCGEKAIAVDSLQSDQRRVATHRNSVSAV